MAGNGDEFATYAITYDKFVQKDYVQHDYLR